MPSRSSAGPVLVAVLLVALVAAMPRGAEAEGLEVTDLTITPDPALVGSKVEIACKLADETDVTGVFLRYCSDVNCFPNIAMTKDAQGFWRAFTSIIESTGQHHFNITVQYTNGSFAWTEERFFTPVVPVSTELKTSHMDRVPQQVKTGVAVEVFCVPEDAANVTSMEVRLKQGSTPLSAVPMTRLTNGTYRASIGPFDSDRPVTYNVTATLVSGSRAWTQDLTFTPKASGGDDDDGFLPAVGAASAVAALMGFAATHRGRRARRSK